MPSEPEHIAKAKSNEHFADSLSLTGRSEVEWAIVALFYSALHYIEAYLCRQFGSHTRDHQTRDKIINRDAHLKRVFVDYQELKTLGWTARYKPSTFSRQSYTEARPHLDAIKTEIGY